MEPWPSQQLVTLAPHVRSVKPDYFEREAMDLKEAIAEMSACVADEQALGDSEHGRYITCDATTCEIVLAAARAFACERCRGYGFQWNEKQGCYKPCPDCKADREKARGK